MDDYKIIVEQEHQTVMAHYEVEAKPAEGYQSEKQYEYYRNKLLTFEFNIFGRYDSFSTNFQHVQDCSAKF